MADNQSTIASAEQISELWTGLREAKCLYKRGDNAGRDGAIRALQVVSEFLMQLEPANSDGLFVPFAALYDALTSLGHGETHAMLRKVQRRGRIRASEGRRSIKGLAAFTVHGLCDLDEPLPAARRSVVSVLRKRKVTPARGKGPITIRTVRLWEEDAAADVGRKDEVAQTYDELAPFFALLKQSPFSITDKKRALLDAFDHAVHEMQTDQKTT